MDEYQMTKLEKSPCVQLKYKLNLTDIIQNDPFLYSKKFMYQKTDVFRVGMKIAGKHCYNPPSISFLLTTNLQKMGMKVKSVLCCYSHLAGKLNEMKEMDLTTNKKNDVDENGGIQLFTETLKLIFENDADETSADLCAYVTVNLSGIVDNYRVHQMDGLLSQQLWSSVTDQQNEVDFQLIANDGKSLSVHKWMLSARSPVFAALFSSKEAITSLHLAVDCTVEKMKQFIKFIYTGEFEGLVSQELMQLAVKYRIKTLEDICRTSLQDVFCSEDKMAVIALRMNAGSYIYHVDEQPDSDLSEMKRKTKFSVFTCTWKVLNLIWKKETEGQETVIMSVPFEHEGKKLFRAELEMRKNPNQAYTLKFLSFGHKNISCAVDEVICSISQEDSSLNQQIMMDDKPTHDEELLQLFSTHFTVPPEEELTTPLSCPFVITFKVKVHSTITSFVNKIIDSTWSGELWAAAVDRNMTDVEFLVGEEAFGAHRSLLATRSPVLAAMFASGMEETATGQVRIEDTDPTTFQHFLKFLYTGMFEPCFLDRELFVVADKYQVDTLMELCRPATKTVDMNHFFNTCLSC